MTGPIIR